MFDWGVSTMADLTQAITRVVVGGAGTKVNASNQFSGKSPAPEDSGRKVKFPRTRNPRRFGPRR